MWNKVARGSDTKNHEAAVSWWAALMYSRPHCGEILAENVATVSQFSQSAGRYDRPESDRWNPSPLIHPCLKAIIVISGTGLRAFGWRL